MTIEDPQHPLVAAFGGADFRITDEIYGYGPPFDRARLRVLLSLDPARTNMGVPWINRRDNDFALAWVKLYGKGRVFNTSFGHMASLYSNPQMLQFYLDAIQFAAGDLNAPTEPRTERPARNVPALSRHRAWNLGSCLCSTGRPCRVGRATRRSGQCATAQSRAARRPQRSSPKTTS